MLLIVYLAHQGILCWEWLFIWRELDMTARDPDILMILFHRCLSGAMRGLKEGSTKINNSNTKKKRTQKKKADNQD